MKEIEPSVYVKPAVEVLLLHLDSPVLRSSSAGASTQDLNEEDFQWSIIK